MRPRRRLTWIIFFICILAVLEGLGYITWHALRLERAEREARAAAGFQESIRLALWRMESEVTPIIAAESARPYFEYLSFYPAERAYTKMWQEVKQGEVLVPSPLLESSGPFIRMHFQIEPDGHITSPQAPTGNMRDMAESHYVDSEFIVLAGHMLEELTMLVQQPAQQQTELLKSIKPGRLTDAATQQRDEPAKLAEAPAPTAVQLQLEVPQTQSGAPLSQQREDSEYKAREKAAQTAQSLNIANESQRKSRAIDGKRPQKSDTLADKNEGPAPAAERSIAPPPASIPAPPTPSSVDPDFKFDRNSPGKDEERKPIVRSLVNDFQAAGRPAETVNVEQGPLRAFWRANPRTGEHELLMSRSVLIDGKTTAQGFWIDWAHLRERLTASTADLLPGAVLSPALDDSAEAAGQRLAAIPVRLLPGPCPIAAIPLNTPTHVTLLVTWAAVLGAIVAIAVVLRTAMQLSERRGRFVSAVTHELRTPLTTFCLYTEMLSDGMVKDEDARRQYLTTLRSESNRLSRIVQNVLDYAGIGGVGRRTPGPSTPISVADLLSRLLPALKQCAERAGMQLEFETPALNRCLVRADPQTVERILLNLVENAGKYAGDSADRRIHVAVSEASGTLRIAVRDHGPGIPASERRRIFHAFHRATRDAHGPKSGLGLGLALAQELARELGGRLVLNKSLTRGAEFALHLPVEYRTGN